MHLADSVALAEKHDVGFNGRPTVSLFGVSNRQNSIQFTLDSAAGVGVFIAGDSPGIIFNSVSVQLNDKSYFADNAHHSATVTVTVTDRSTRNIKGRLNGTVVSDAGDKISIDGSFDMNF